MRKLTPMTFSEEENQELEKQLGLQDESREIPKSMDPKNFPVFDIPVNKKVFIYVPNHTVQVDSVDQLRMDEPLIHSVTMGRQYLSIRCTDGVTLGGHDGGCAICDVCQDPWDLAAFQIEEKCKLQNLNPDDKENKTVQSIRSAAFSDRKVKDAVRYYTFPIVVFDTVNDDGKTLKKDEDGNYIYTIMWYSISKQQYAKTWEKTLEGTEDELTHPGGNFFMLNYTYDTKGKDANKRDSANNLVVALRKIKNSEKLRHFLDEQTEGWTPQKARETVIKNMFYTKEDMEQIASEAIESTVSLLEIYKAAKAGALPGGADTADGFKLEKKEDADGTDGAVDMSGDTDMDAEEE